MKTVTIPTCANPFVVIVNGIKYTYPAGATMEVPDDVAEVIEQHEEAKTEPAPVAPPFVAVPSSGASGGGGGGAETAKVLNFNDYNFTKEGTTHPLTVWILSLVGSNGGRHSGSSDPTFWADVSTDKPLKFVLDASLMASGMVIEAEANSITKYNGNVVSVEITFVTYVQSFMRITIYIDNIFDASETAISVIVEPLDLNA